jgi:Family of unknown function (DUF5691)
MMERLIAGDTAEIEKAMMLGLAKSPAGKAEPLTVLSLLAARKKFDRPAAPRSNPDPAPGCDATSRYMSDEQRRLLVKLMTGKDADVSGCIALATLKAIRAAGLSLHPFDYSRLEDFIAQHAIELGVQERDWLRAVRPERKQTEELYLEGPLTEDMLPQLAKAQKLQFLRQLRAGNPARARELIEDLIASEPANVRAELVTILAVKLSEKDRVFLEGLSQDRAQSVRDAATSLLERVRGTDAFARRIENLKEQIKVASSGILRRSKVLKFAAQSTAKRDDVLATQRVLLYGLNLADIAAALGEPKDALMDAAENSDKAGMISVLLLTQAAKEGLLDLVEKHQSILDDLNAEASIDVLEEACPALDAGQRERLLRVLVRRKSWWFKPDPAHLERAYRTIARPLPADLARTLLDDVPPPENTAHGNLIERYYDALAPLVPQSMSSVFVAKAEMQAHRASLYHRFLMSLPKFEM